MSYMFTRVSLYTTCTRVSPHIQYAIHVHPRLTTHTVCHTCAPASHYIYTVCHTCAPASHHTYSMPYMCTRVSLYIYSMPYMCTRVSLYIYSMPYMCTRVSPHIQYAIHVHPRLTTYTVCHTCAQHFSLRRNVGCSEDDVVKMMLC